MFMIFLTFVSAISISVIAAGYSIVGLATLFAGAVVPIIAMGTALEAGKLVAASWLYNNWRNPLVPKSLKSYLFSAVLILIFITSMGIFGFLSKAHLDQVQPTSGNNIKIELIESQIASQQKIIDRSQKALDQLDKSIEVYFNEDMASRGLSERKKQEEERSDLAYSIEQASNKITDLSTKKAELQLEQDKIEAEVGPIKYVAELIYGDTAKDHFDEAVRWVIIVLIFVFDPLAVLLLIAANISLRSRKEAKAEEEQQDFDEVTGNLDKTSATLKKVRAENRRYKAFIKKLGAKDLAELDPDEIRIKMDQVMDWNDTEVKSTTSKPKRYVEVDKN